MFLDIELKECCNCLLIDGCPKLEGCIDDKLEKYKTEIPRKCPIINKYNFLLEDDLK